MNGHKLSQLLNDVDDDLVVDAMPPAWQTGNGMPAKQKSGFWRAFGRVMDSGWTAAVLSVVVAVAVIVAIVAAGQNGAGGTNVLPDGVPGDAPGGQVGSPGETVDTPPRADVLPTPDGADPSDAALLLHINGSIYTEQYFGLTDSYIISKSVNYFNPSDGESYEAAGAGAAYRLSELSDELRATGYSIGHAAWGLTFTSQESDTVVTNITAYDLSYNHLAQFTTNELGRLELDILRGEDVPGVFLMVEVRTDRTTDKYHEESAAEFPLYISFVYASDDYFQPREVADLDYPTISLKIEHDVLARILDSDLAVDDPELLVIERYPEVSRVNASRMIAWLRAIPVPVLEGRMPDFVSYELDSQQFVFAFDITYIFTVYGNASLSNDRIHTLPRLEEPVKVFEHTAVLAEVRAEDKVREVCLDMMGFLVSARVQSEEGGLSDREYANLFGGFEAKAYKEPQNWDPPYGPETEGETDISWPDVETDISWPDVETDISWPDVETDISWPDAETTPIREPV